MFSYSSSISRGVVDCTPELFYQVVRSEKVGKICAEIADAHELKMRGEMSREDFETFKSEHKKRLPVFLFHASFPNGRRISADAVPSGLSIFDLDHISTLPIPQLRPSEKSEGGDDGGHDSLENVLKALKERGCIGKSFSNLPYLFSPSSPIALIHISPSCEGLRFVFRLPEGMSLSDGQKWFAGQLGINDYDVCVKDYARCSFAVPEDYILYVNEGKLFETPSDSSLTPALSFREGASPNPSERRGVPIRSEEDKQGDDCKSSANRAPSLKERAGVRLERGSTGNSLPKGGNSSKPSSYESENEAPSLKERAGVRLEPGEAPSLKERAGVRLELGEASSSSLSFRGIPYARIIQVWWEHTGGEPAQGERNIRLYSLAVNIRTICDNDPELICRLIPTFGLPETEVRNIVHSACKEQPKGMTRLMREVLREASLACSGKDVSPLGDSGEEGEPVDHKSHSTSLLLKPEMLRGAIGLRESIQNIPAKMRFPVLCSILPLAGAYADGVEVKYCDGKRMRLGLLSVITGPQASGKSACKDVLDVWLRQMNEDDAEARRKEEEWRQERKNRKANEKAPSDPQVLIRNVPVTISCSTLLKRLKNSRGHMLFSFGEELDTLRKTNGAGSWSSKYDIYRLAFDNGQWGQDYNSDQAESGLVSVAYNWSILGTYGALRKCFGRDNVENGLSSRVIISEMPDNSFAPIEVYKEITDSQYESINKAVNLLRSSTGFIDTPRLRKTIGQWVEEKRLEALQKADIVMDTYRKRAAVIGFRCGVIFSLLAGKETKTCLAFARMMADYVLEGQCHVFGEILMEQVKGNNEASEYNSVNQNVFQELPASFENRDVQRLRPEITPGNLRVILFRWKNNGWIEKDGERWRKKL